MTLAAELYALQDVDITLDRARQRLEEIAEALGETEELIEARNLVEEKAAALEALRSRQRDLDLDVETVRKKAEEVEGKLYGGRVSNPKELQDLQADHASLKRQIGGREDELLGLMMEIEEAEAELRGARSTLDEIEAAWSDSQKGLLAEKAELEPLVQEKQGVREEKSSGIDRATLSLYDLLRERRGGQAVARLDRGMCEGCRISLPSAVLQKARSGAGLVQCVSCERILVVT